MFDGRKIERFESHCGRHCRLAGLLLFKGRIREGSVSGDKAKALYPYNANGVSLHK
jgi:hypothetical protein